jgi:DNA-binding CsgD family transcriptional regulator
MPSKIAGISAEALMVALDCVCTPTFLLDADGHIVHANRAGIELLRNSSTLRKVDNRLVGRRSKEAKILTAVVARVAEDQRPELLRLLSRNDRVSLLMTVTPVPGDNLVTACIADLQANRPPLAGWIQRAFDLSQQNAELAENLMFGVSLAEFASSKNITLGAVRTRLKKLFAKTGSKSQAALVSKLLQAVIIAPHGPQ